LNDLVQVAVLAPVRGLFSYRLAEEGSGVVPGREVEVPFGRQRLPGFIVSHGGPPPPEGADLKDARLVDRSLPEELFRFLLWTADYYLHPPGEVIKAALPPELPVSKSGRRRAPKQPASDPDTKAKPAPALNPEQQLAVSAIEEAITRGGFAPFLLQGVTGSGKTEVYLRAIDAALRAGRGALVLVPEIALTPQLVARFSARFGARVATLHSGLSRGERVRAWNRLRSGEAQVAVGVRAAVFAPVQRLGLLVVDEEHDGSFKQEDRLCYHARDMAVARAKLSACPVILGSATPSLETLANVERERYRLLTLTQRIDVRPMPAVELASLRGSAPPGAPGATLLREALLGGLEESLKRGEQAILFLNRRGHAGSLVCQSCGQVSNCPNCSVSMTVHLRRGRLLCHYCGAIAGIPEACPLCRGPLVELGAGTERLEAEVRDRFPDARVARLDRDSSGEGELRRTLAAFEAGELDVMVGTQLVAKGHDFPRVTFVGVVLADIGLNLPDFRAAERAFQLLVQVSGRAGRGSSPGKVVIQTYHPDHPALRHAAAHDQAGFAKAELWRRRALGFPPFAKLCSLRVDSASPVRAERAARQLAKEAEMLLRRGSTKASLLGPAPAPLTRLKGRTRWQMLLRAPTHGQLRQLVVPLQQLAQPLVGVRVVFDMDPMSML
jgi:primosomal protein N' (replication factor Y) (superfamily II helicase)